MNSSSCIEQKGVIEEIVDGLAKVRISSFEACATCHAKSACGISEGSTRYYEVPVADNEYSKGEPVLINMKRIMGLKATLIAYIIPFLLVITILFLFTWLDADELITGIVSLIILVPYFSGLYLFRNHLRRSFIFTLRKVI